MDEINIDDEWSQFLSQMRSGNSTVEQLPVSLDPCSAHSIDVPICDELNISTTTKVLFLNQAINISEVFWNIPVIEYWKPSQGVIKKQMKIVSHTHEEYAEYENKLKNLSYYTEHVIKRIDNPGARRNRFKDERKITVGISKKDIMNCRGKVKNAFYNCFALILRFKYGEAFREIHVKIFNTGKMEIPGIVNDDLLNIVRDMILSILTPILGDAIEHQSQLLDATLHTQNMDVNDVTGNVLDEVDENVVLTDVFNLPKSIPVRFIENSNEDSVLINSNFNCGFYINREKLYSILRSDKYNIETAYDPCSYPGVKCKFYFNHENGFIKEKQLGYISHDDCYQKMDELGENKKYTEVSFMIFRTGSCLIVGNCTLSILTYIYGFIKNMLSEEYGKIATSSEEHVTKIKQIKIRKRMINVTREYVEGIQSGNSCNSLTLSLRPAPNNV